MSTAKSAVVTTITANRLTTHVDSRLCQVSLDFGDSQGGRYGDVDAVLGAMGALSIAAIIVLRKER